MSSHPEHPQPAQQPVPPAVAPVPATRRRSWFARHKFLTAVGVLVVIGIAGASLGGGGDEPAAGGGGSATGGTSDAGGAQEEPAEAAPGIGATVADGKFEFVVSQVETGVTRVGTDLFGQAAQGQFVLVHLTVSNIGDDAQYFDGSSQKAYDASGRTYSSDGSAAVYVDESNSFLNQINPGNQVQGVVVFDVPADVALTELELHDSPFSGGVRVALG